jgi:hypothetical protein
VALRRLRCEPPSASRALDAIVGRWRRRRPAAIGAACTSEGCLEPLVIGAEVDLFHFPIGRIVVDTGCELRCVGAREAHLPRIEHALLPLLRALADRAVLRDPLDGEPALAERAPLELPLNAVYRRSRIVTAGVALSGRLLFLFVEIGCLFESWWIRPKTAAVNLLSIVVVPLSETGIGIVAALLS